MELGELGCVGVWDDELRKDYQQYEQQEQTNHCHFVEVFVPLIREDEIPRLWVSFPHYNYYNFIMSQSREFKGQMPGYIRQGVPPHLQILFSARKELGFIGAAEKLPQIRV